MCGSADVTSGLEIG